jgi:hypothetical protein
MAKLHMSDGRLGVFILPINEDRELALKVIRKVPMLESAVRMPSETKRRMKQEGGAHD